MLGALSWEPETKISYHRLSDTAHVVSELPTARKPLWYIFSSDFIQTATFLASNPSARHLESYARDVFITLRLSPFCRRVLARQKQCGTYQCCYKFCLWIFLFFNLFFQDLFCYNFFPKFFFFLILFTTFFFKFFFKIFFTKFVSQNFFINIFFPKYFFQKFFLRALLSMPPRLQRLNGLYVSVLWKIWYTASGRNWTLVSCDKVLFFDSYCSHHTRREIVYYDTSVRGTRLTHACSELTQVRKSRSHVYRILSFKTSAARLDEIRVAYIIF